MIRSISAQIRPLTVAVAILAGAQVAGCGLRESVARQTSLHTYRERCDAVLPAVSRALRDRGYDLRRSADGGALVVETEWRARALSSKSSAIPTRDRYTARLMSAGTSSCELRVARVSDGVWPSTERDLEVEWEALREVDPEAARRIEAGESPSGTAAVR